jgi:hypothetical protein
VIWLGKALAAAAVSAIETAASPCSLNSRLAESSRRDRICRPAVRVARTVCLGSLKPSFAAALFMLSSVVEAMGTVRQHLIIYLYVIQTKSSSAW